MKPKREITLGEMQDECKTRVKCCTGCPYKEVCGEIPKLLDLTDPPRFTEAQMAFLRGWYAIGATWIGDSGLGLLFVIGTNEAVIGKFMSCLVGIESSYPSDVKKVIDLAEMFGKEGEK